MALKTVNNLNPNYIKDIFTPKLHPKVRPNDILVKHRNTITYGTKSLKTLGRKMWNQLPKDIKSRHLMPILRNILTLGFDQNVVVMCALIFETLSLNMCANHLPEGKAVMYFTVFY